MPPKCSFHDGYRLATSESEGSTLAEAAAGASDRSSASLQAANFGGLNISEASPVPGFAPPPAPVPGFGPPATSAMETSEASGRQNAPPATRGGYGTLKKSGGYGKLSAGAGPSASGSASPPTASAKVYPKSANFTRMATGLEVEDLDEAPRSARAAVRSWSASGGNRDATFKKKSTSKMSSANLDRAGNPKSAVGFAVIIAAAERPYSNSSFPDEIEEDGSTVALLLEELIIRLESDESLQPAALAGSRERFAEASLPPHSSGRAMLLSHCYPNCPPAAPAFSLLLPKLPTCSEELSRRISMDLEMMSKAQGFTLRSELPLAPPSMTVVGSVLSVATEADAAARALPDDVAEGPLSSDDDDDASQYGKPLHDTESATAEGTGVKRGGYGKMGGGVKGNASKHARVASWSDSGGFREATFKQKVPRPPSMP